MVILANISDHLLHVSWRQIWWVLLTYWIYHTKEVEEMENTRITTRCWTVIDRKILELTKEDTPHPKTKEKTQWDGRRGTITVKSNPITAGWVAHRLENTYTTEVHALEWRLWAPRQAYQPGDLAMGGGIPRVSDFEGYWNFIAGLRQNWGKQRLHSWRAHTK